MRSYWHRILISSSLEVSSFMKGDATHRFISSVHPKFSDS